MSSGRRGVLAELGHVLVVDLSGWGLVRRLVHTDGSQLAQVAGLRQRELRRSKALVHPYARPGYITLSH